MGRIRGLAKGGANVIQRQPPYLFQSGRRCGKGSVHALQMHLMLHHMVHQTLHPNTPAPKTAIVMGGVSIEVDHNAMAVDYNKALQDLMNTGMSREDAKTLLFPFTYGKQGSLQAMYQNFTQIYGVSATPWQFPQPIVGEKKQVKDDLRVIVEMLLKELGNTTVWQAIKSHRKEKIPRHLEEALLAYGKETRLKEVLDPYLVADDFKEAVRG